MACQQDVVSYGMYKQLDNVMTSQRLVMSLNK